MKSEKISWIAFVAILVMLFVGVECKSQVTNHENVNKISEADEFLANCLINGKISNYSDNDIKNVFNRLLSYANNGHVESMYYVAFMYQNNYLGTIEFDKAFYWYLRAADLGHEPSMLAVANSYMMGKSTFCNQPINFHKAEKWLLLLAEKGNVDALNDLGYLYYMGCRKDDEYDETEDDFPADLNKSLAMYTEAANRGNAYAMYHLGELYKNDFKNAKRSLEWYEKAMTSGSYEAARCLGDIYFYGDENLKSFPVHVDIDYKKALKFYNKEYELSAQHTINVEHAKEHVAETCYYIGNTYDCGFNCDEDLQEAIKWYRLAVSFGYEKANEQLEVLTKRYEQLAK